MYPGLSGSSSSRSYLFAGLHVKFSRAIQHKYQINWSHGIYLIGFWNTYNYYLLEWEPNSDRYIVPSIPLTVFVFISNAPLMIVHSSVVRGGPSPNSNSPSSLLFSACRFTNSFNSIERRWTYIENEAVRMRTREERRELYNKYLFFYRIPHSLLPVSNLTG